MGVLMEGRPVLFHAACLKYLVYPGLLRSHGKEESFQLCSAFGSIISLPNGEELRTWYLCKWDGKY